MNFNDIIAELPKLTFAQRELLARRALDLDEPDLAPVEAQLTGERIAECQRELDSGIGFDEILKNLRAQFGPLRG